MAGLRLWLVGGCSWIASVGQPQPDHLGSVCLSPPFLKAGLGLFSHGWQESKREEAGPNEHFNQPGLVSSLLLPHWPEQITAGEHYSKPWTQRCDSLRPLTPFRLPHWPKNAALSTIFPAFCFSQHSEALNKEGILSFSKSG